MALTPENNSYLYDEYMENENVEIPSKTWFIDFENGRIGSFIVGELALRQFVQKAISTARNKYPIYTDQYGSEIEEELIGRGTTEGYLNAVVPRMIQEALIYDDRIEDVQVSYERLDNSLAISVFIVPMIGEAFTEEVSINGL
ncbi:DUF2634 domain-containing protein [Bacillus massiliigorillae]|uniref:DUF2634 domain-containing protein n=1 Tax=Bacillus massiliigorillae TaxID=1243664 RepID=UPI0003A22D33|nr:DUF2634 domain-containing protein [Bacillus massiliigorillae]